MADYVVAKVNTAYITYINLISQADTKLLKSSPTIASGDFKSSLDGAAYGNLATLPTNTPSSSVGVKIQLSAGETNGDNINVACIDAAGAEWCDQGFTLQTCVRGLADLAFPNTSGRGMVVDANGLVDANAVKVGPTGSGTAQTAGDIPARLPAALTANGNMKSSLVEILTTALTETAGLLAAAFKKFFNVATPTGTVNSIPDAVAGATGGIAIVGSAMTLASGAVTAAVVATGAIDADALATDAVTEISTGILAATPTQRNLSAVTAPTVSDALIAALSQGAGSWVRTGTSLVLKNLDGTTFRTFTLDDATAPTQRT